MPATAAAALFALASAGPLRGQDGAPAHALLVGQRVVDGQGGDELWTLGLADHVRECLHVAGRCYTVEGRTVDLDGADVLEVDGTDLVLRRLPDRTLWRRPLADVGTPAGASAGLRLLAGDRVVLPARDGGLVGLDRATGAERWRRTGLPQGALLVDADLLVATGAVAGVERLCGLSLRNGALAFDGALPWRAQRIAAAPHGVLVQGDGRVAAFLAGRELFRRRLPVSDVAATQAGWLVLGGGRLGALDREGGPRWSVAIAGGGDLDVLRLTALPSGEALVVGHHRMSDSGVSVQLVAADGKLHWQRQVEGLGIPHSKYFHEAHARAVGDVVYVVSMGSGGAFWAALDLASGELLRRHRL